MHAMIRVERDMPMLGRYFSDAIILGIVEILLILRKKQ